MFTDHPPSAPFTRGTAAQAWRIVAAAVLTLMAFVGHAATHVLTRDG